MTDQGEAPEAGRIVTDRQGRVFRIGIDRPRKLNGFTPAMGVGLSEAFTAYEADDEAWCAVLYAVGDNFTAGLQLTDFRIDRDLFPSGLVDPLDLHPPKRTKPVVCAVKGYCYTIGIELMLAADIVVAAAGTKFGQIEVKRGLMAFGGATVRFVERAGWGNAMRYLLTGDGFDAETALRLGFVQEVVPDGEADARALAIAETIARQAPLAVRATRANAMTGMEDGADAAVAQFHRINAEILKTEDFAEGVRSFTERRDAQFKGR